MSNSEIFANDANAYFRRCFTARHAFTTDHLLRTLDNGWLLGASVGEFGIGNGNNMFLLKEYAKRVVGFDISPEAVKHVALRISSHPDASNMAVHEVNLCKEFDVAETFQLILFGFFAYYCDDREMEIAARNAKAHLSQGGLLHVVDFMTRSPVVKNDSRNDMLAVHKRTLSWWMALLHDFDLIDYRLWDTTRIEGRRSVASPNVIDIDVSQDDDLWMFSAVFKERIR